MPLPKPVTMGETMASSRSQDIPWLRELAMLSALVTVANVVLDKHGMGSYIAKSQLFNNFGFWLFLQNMLYINHLTSPENSL